MGREAGDGSGTKGGGGAGDVEGPRAEVGPGHPVPSPARRLFSPTRLHPRLCPVFNFLGAPWPILPFQFLRRH